MLFVGSMTLSCQLLARWPDGLLTWNVHLWMALCRRWLSGVDELGDVLLVDHSQLWGLLEPVLSVRIFDRLSRERNLAFVLADLRTGLRTRWDLVALQQCFGMHSTLRRAPVKFTRTITTAYGRGHV